MERTVLIANTSNMPVAAREASIYTGITIAEYYRDMGYDVALMADSTSRWAEALREISGRLEEMPAEEGFPAYLATRLAEFYERAGLVTTLCAARRVGQRHRRGVAAGRRLHRAGHAAHQTLRAVFLGTRQGARQRPASSRRSTVRDSYSDYADALAAWWRGQGFADWSELRARGIDLLTEEVKLQQIVRLVGEEALPDRERMLLDGAWVLRNAFLQQHAFDPIDRYSTPDKQLRMLRAVFHYLDRGLAVVARRLPVYRVKDLPVHSALLRMRFELPNDAAAQFDALIDSIDTQMDDLLQE